MLLYVGTKSEIGDFDCSVEAQQNIVRLDVSMDDALTMEETYCMQNLTIEYSWKEKHETFFFAKLQVCLFWQAHTGDFPIRQARPTQVRRRTIFFFLFTSRHTAEIWRSFITVSVTTSVSGPLEVTLSVYGR